MEFQVQSVYPIYTWLIVYTILNLAYPKEYNIIVLKSLFFKSIIYYTRYGGRP